MRNKGRRNISKLTFFNISKFCAVAPKQYGTNKKHYAIDSSLGFISYNDAIDACYTLHRSINRSIREPSCIV